VQAQEVGVIGVFAGLTPQALQEIAAKAVRRPFMKGETIFNQGDRPARFHALLSGWVRILQAGPEGELSVIRFVGPGELFGSFAMFSGSGYAADAVAAAASEELSWSDSHLLQLMDRFPSIALNLVAVAAHRLMELQERVREVSTQSAGQRIANALLRSARNSGNRDDDRGVEIPLPLVRRDLAAMSATTLYTASRIMAAWERKGIVASSAKRISLLLPAELRRIAEGA
jgi:CRP-like cAMP-binding protein